MGLRDVILGRRKLKAPAPDRLFAMSTAYVDMEGELGIRTRGKAAIVFQSLETADFQSIVSDMEELVSATTEETATTIETREDAFGYSWMIVSDPDFDDLVVSINAVGSALEAGGYGDRVLAAVFSFEDKKGRALYWIYNYKRGAFYPFVPAPGEQQRDSTRELQLKAQVGAGLPVEPELARWFPLWDIPI